MTRVGPSQKLRKEFWFFGKDNLPLSGCSHCAVGSEHGDTKYPQPPRNDEWFWLRVDNETWMTISNQTGLIAIVKDNSCIPAGSGNCERAKTSEPHVLKDHCHRFQQCAANTWQTCRCWLESSKYHDGPILNATVSRPKFANHVVWCRQKSRCWMWFDVIVGYWYEPRSLGTTWMFDFSWGEMMICWSIGHPRAYTVDLATRLVFPLLTVIPSDHRGKFSWGPKSSNIMVSSDLPWNDKCI